MIYPQISVVRSVNMETLKIFYSEKINIEMDKEFQKIAKKYNYEWIGQGTDLTTGIRDISFTKED